MPPPTGTATSPHHHPPAPQPGPTTPLIPVPTPNFARNSPTTTSNIEFRSLELQRFQPLLKLHPIELHASFLEATRSNAMPPPTGTEARPPHPRLGTTSATKFTLLASISAHARKSSPSARKTPQNQPFFACWANFFAVWPRIHSCWASFFAPMSIPGITPPSTATPTAQTSRSVRTRHNAGGTLAT